MRELLSPNGNSICEVNQHPRKLGRRDIYTLTIDFIDPVNFLQNF